MSKLTPHTFLGCQDCTMMVAGYTQEELGWKFSTEYPPLSRLYEQNVPVPEMILTGQIEHAFHKEPCDTCGNPDAGSRHEIVAFYRNEVKA